jgi:hypothetical protein
LVVEGVLDGEALARMRGEVDRIVAEAGKVAANDDYDLEDTYSPRNPRVRRIKSPHRFSLGRSFQANSDPRRNLASAQSGRIDDNHRLLAWASCETAAARELASADRVHQS